MVKSSSRVISSPSSCLALHRAEREQAVGRCRWWYLRTIKVSNKQIRRETYILGKAKAQSTFRPEIRASSVPSLGPSTKSGAGTGTWVIPERVGVGEKTRSHLVKLYGVAGELKEILDQYKTCSNLNGGPPSVPTDPAPLPFALRRLGLHRRFFSSYTYACRPVLDQPTLKHVTPRGLRS